MKILVATDSFKNCMSSFNVGKHLKAGLTQGMPGAIVDVLPIADGGEGTVQALVSATGGEIIETTVHDPLMRLVPASWGILGDGQTAVIEIAAAAGMELLKETELNPSVTTTFGVGELIREALDKGLRKIIVGLGGSATNDAGAGMFQALGGDLLDHHGANIEKGGLHLHNLATIRTDHLDPRIAACNIVAACDVTNPLCGSQGAAHIYARQKGADDRMVEALDAGLRHLAQIARDQREADIADLPGAGAAGGLGGGLVAFLGGKLIPGFDILSEAIHLEETIQQYNLVITGEGKIDGQTASGKAPMGIARLAGRYRIPVIMVGGTVGEEAEELLKHGISVIIPITDRPMHLEEAIARTDILLEKTGRRIGAMLNLFEA